MVHSSIGVTALYLLGGGLINSFILTRAENRETSQSIQDGPLSTLLTLVHHIDMGESHPGITEQVLKGDFY